MRERSARRRTRARRERADRPPPGVGPRRLRETGSPPRFEVPRAHARQRCEQRQLAQHPFVSRCREALERLRGPTRARAAASSKASMAMARAAAWRAESAAAPGRPAAARPAGGGRSPRCAPRRLAAPSSAAATVRCSRARRPDRAPGRAPRGRGRGRTASRPAPPAAPARRAPPPRAAARGRRGASLTTASTTAAAKSRPTTEACLEDPTGLLVQPGDPPARSPP